MFHDALKGWSCCSRRSTDFTEFLNIPGCTNGQHSNEKPPEPEKKASAEVNCPEVTETLTTLSNAETSCLNVQICEVY